MTPGMKSRHFGRLVLISSLYSLVSRTNRLAYTASKNALTGVAKNLTLELAPFGILTNCVALGYVMTDMTRKNLSTEEISKRNKINCFSNFADKKNSLNCV
jgi:3-oxoacyl-[acyl-carrier protein] reductase